MAERKSGKESNGTVNATEDSCDRLPQRFVVCGTEWAEMFSGTEISLCNGAEDPAEPGKRRVASAKC